MKKKIVLIFLILNNLLLISCGRYVELQGLAIVTSLGIDVEDGKVIVTCEVINPSGSGLGQGAGAGSSSVTYVQGRGDTVLDAISDTSLHFDRRLFFSHANTLIFGEAVAKAGIAPYIDLFLREDQGRENIYLVVAKDAKAYEIMGIRSDLSNSFGSYLRNILENYNLNGKCIIASIIDFNKYYYEINNEAIISVVTKSEHRNIDMNTASENPTRYILDVGGGAVFKDDILIGYFDEEEIMGFNFIVDRITSGTFIFTKPSSLYIDKTIIGETINFSTAEILRSNTKLNVSVIDEDIKLNIDIKTTFTIAEEMGAVDLKNRSIIEKLEEELEIEIKRLVNLAMKKSQDEFKQDNFSIANALYKKYPDVWNNIASNWDDVFSEIHYDINVDANIVKVGMLNIPISVRLKD